MFDKHAIVTFKKNNKPKWSSPFMKQSLKVAQWQIPGEPFPTYELLDLEKNTNLHGWFYEGN